MPCWRSSQSRWLAWHASIRSLGLEDLGHVDVEVDRHGPTLAVSAFNGIDK